MNALAVPMRSAAPASAAQRTAAVVVTFRPEIAQLNQLVAVLARQCRIVYVMDNGGGRDAITHTPEIEAAMCIVDMGGNKGIGEALNFGFRLAAEAGFDYVTTFDQDSAPMAGQVDALVAASEKLQFEGRNVAAVGPRIVDLRPASPAQHLFMRRRIGWPIGVDCAAGADYVESDFLITSGSLISTSAFVGVGPYDSDLFVDYTDMEWCFRALARGYRSFGVCSVTMHHELSTGASVSILGMTLLGYSPIRRYYYARNAVLLCRRRHVALGWKARLLAGLAGRVLWFPFAVKFSEGWSRGWRMLIRGTMDGIRGIGGAYPP
jgi:rhamnosyltransferase